MERVKKIQSELSVEEFLHRKGYTYFNIPKLTYKEIQQLIDGHEINNSSGE